MNRRAVALGLGWLVAAAMLPVMAWLGFQYAQLSEHRERSFGFSAAQIANGLFLADRRLQEAVGGAEAGDLRLVQSRLLQARDNTQGFVNGVQHYDFLLGNGRSSGLYFVLSFYRLEVGDLRLRVEQAGEVSEKDVLLLRDLQHDVAELHRRLDAETLLERDLSLIGARMQDFGEVAKTPSVREYYDRLTGRIRAASRAGGDSA